MAREGPYLVIAGAGSGKTRALVYRVAHLVEQGLPPESILLLTFTRRAAQEMLRRATSLLDDRCRRVAGGTFHSFANQVLRRYATKLGYRDGFTIVDRADAQDMIGILRSELGFDQRGRRFPRKDTLLDLFSRQINTGRELEELVAMSCPQFNDELEAIADLSQHYRERKKTQNVMDYDDLLVELRALLVEHPAVRARLSATYRFIMVDEYQDTNRLQAHIAALLASAHGNLMVVGDDAQSIYSFRGADFRNIIDFPRIFPSCRTLLLEQNYRSTQPILDFANAIMAKAEERFTKNLFSELTSPDRPFFVRVADDYDQARFVAERILELREEGVPLAEIAVLTRAAWQSNSLELELRQRNIPFQKFGGLRFVEAAHVKDVCALLKVAINPLDATAWFRILQLYEGIGPATAQGIAQAVIDAGGDLGVLSRLKRFGRRVPAGTLAELGEILAALADATQPLSARLEAAIQHYQPLMVRKYDDAVRRQGDLDAVQTLAMRYTELEPFLSDLAIDPPETSRADGHPDTEDEHITVSTVHSAKGLEWHTVFVLDLITGRFPSMQSLRDRAASEEERRLFYVAVTRAKRQLYLLKPEEVARRGGYQELTELSSLLAEIADFDDLVEELAYGMPNDVDEIELDTISLGDPEQLRRIQDYFGKG